MDGSWLNLKSAQYPPLIQHPWNFDNHRVFAQIYLYAEDDFLWRMRHHLIKVGCHLRAEGVTAVLAFTCSSMNRRLAEPYSGVNHGECSVHSCSLLMEIDSLSIILRIRSTSLLLCAFSWFFSRAMFRALSSNKLCGRLLRGVDDEAAVWADESLPAFFLLNCFRRVPLYNVHDEQRDVLVVKFRTLQLAL